MSSFRALAGAQLKAFLRDRMLLFWTLAFPLMFLVLFGGIFGGSSTSKLTVVQVGQVALFDQMPAQAKAQLAQVIELKHSSDQAAALAQVRHGDVAGAIAMDGTTVRLWYSRADQVTSAMVTGTMDGIVNAANLAASGRPATFTLQTQQVEDTALKAIQYVTPGLLAWAVAMGAVFGAGLTLVQWRKNGLLRRLRMSPASTTSIIMSRTLVTLVLVVIQTVVFLAVALLLYGLKLNGSWWAALPLMFMGALAFQSIGLVVGAISKTEEAASGLANLIILPMAFLSGSFIPLDSAPGWLQTAAKFLPMGWLNTGMSDVMVRGQGPSAIVVPMLMLAGCALVFAAIAARLFRWDA